jgi:putative ABC transport system permease protein
MFLEAIWIGIDAIWANKLRSLLTVLGNIVAVTSIIAVVSLIQGMNTKVTDVIVSEAGADAFLIDRVGLIFDEDEAEKARRNNPRVTMEDAEAVLKFSPIIQAIMARSQRRGEIRYRDKVLERAAVQGVSEDYLWFGNYDAEQGRLITRTEILRRRPVTVLGWGTADRLFGEENPLEKSIKIQGIHFRVVGVSEKKGTVFGQSQDEFALIPLGVFQKIFGSRTNLDLMVKPRTPELLDQAMDDATVALRIHRRLKPKERDNFGILTSGTLIEIWRSATSGIFAVLVGVVALSLVVGGIVIMNIMLMIVTERTREIGLRKALGARRKDIVWQVLMESITLSTTGGIVGTALGFVVALTIESLTPVPADVQAWSVALGILMTAAVGLFFGMYPALQAARLDPIEALRRE